MPYQPPGTTVNVNINPRIINLGDTTRITAIVAMGPSSVGITDEAVIRGTGSIDYLSVYSGAGVSVSRITDQPGLVPGLLNYVPISSAGGLYNLSSASVNSAGSLSWPTHSVDPNVPVIGSTYYVTYSASIPSSQLLPSTYSDKQPITAAYGPEGNTTGMLTIGGSISLENGAPGVTLVQASGSSYNMQAYQNAIDLLQTKTNIEQLIVLFPSGSVTMAQQQALMVYAYSHVLKMSQNNHERGLLLGSPSPYYASDGQDTIGDPTTLNTYAGIAATLKNQNVGYVVPSRVWRYDPNGNYMELDGNFAAAAVGAVQVAQPLICTPITGFSVVGIQIQDEKWNDFQANTLSSYNCLVLQSVNGFVTIKDAITTDPTSADTQELSVVAQQRLVKRSIRNGLNSTYINKGFVILPDTPSDVASTVNAILDGLVTQGEIYAFGQNNNPLTGETATSAVQDPTEPRRILVTCSVKYLYPLKWILVSVNTYI